MKNLNFFLLSIIWFFLQIFGFDFSLDLGEDFIDFFLIVVENNIGNFFLEEKENDFMYFYEKFKFFFKKRNSDDIGVKINEVKFVIFFKFLFFFIKGYCVLFFLNKLVLYVRLKVRVIVVIGELFLDFKIEQVMLFKVFFVVVCQDVM